MDSIGYIVSPEDLKAHMENGGAAVCSVRLSSGSDWTVTIETFSDYEIVADDIIFDYEIILLDNEKVR